MRVLLRWLLVALVVVLALGCIYGKRGGGGGGTNIGSGSDLEPWGQGGRTGPAAVGER